MGKSKARLNQSTENNVTENHQASLLLLQPEQTVQQAGAKPYPAPPLVDIHVCMGRAMADFVRRKSCGAVSVYDVR
jgi:hypothetical protein